MPSTADAALGWLLGIRPAAGIDAHARWRQTEKTKPSEID
jgi:hypothetical protein